jgi:hypothetical protein
MRIGLKNILLVFYINNNNINIDKIAYFNLFLKIVLIFIKL